MEFTADEVTGVLEGEDMDTVDYYQSLGDEDFDLDTWTGGVAITGLFRKPYKQVLDTETSDPSFTFKTSQMPGAVKNDGLIFETVRYIAREVHAMGNGTTTILLRLAS